MFGVQKSKGGECLGFNVHKDSGVWVRQSVAGQVTGVHHKTEPRPQSFRGLGSFRFWVSA